MKHLLVVQGLRALVRDTLATSLAIAAAARDEAAHAESKAENKYDTRATEASYLAAGQAVRVASLQRLAAFFDQLGADVLVDDAVAGLGALVGVEDAEGAVLWCFLAPDGGGITVAVEGVDVRIVTRDSPLGAALVGAAVGDGVEITQPRAQELTVVWVSCSV